MSPDSIHQNENNTPEIGSYWHTHVLPHLHHCERSKDNAFGHEQSGALFHATYIRFFFHSQ